MKVTVCMGSNCVLMGAMSIHSQLEDLQESMPELNIELETAKCLGNCKNEEGICPVVKIDDELIKNASSQQIMERLTAEC